MCFYKDAASKTIEEMELVIKSKLNENEVINQKKEDLRIAVKELHAYMDDKVPMIKLSFDVINKNGERMSVTREMKESMLIGDVAGHINKLAKLIVDTNDLY